jgi:hypothetical protein
MNAYLDKRKQFFEILRRNLNIYLRSHTVSNNPQYTRKLQITVKHVRGDLDPDLEILSIYVHYIRSPIALMPHIFVKFVFPSWQSFPDQDINYILNQVTSNVQITYRTRLPLQDNPHQEITRYEEPTNMSNNIFQNCLLNPDECNAQLLHMFSPVILQWLQTQYSLYNYVPPSIPNPEDPNIDDPFQSTNTLGAILRLTNILDKIMKESFQMKKNI